MQSVTGAVCWHACERSLSYVALRKTVNTIIFTPTQYGSGGGWGRPPLPPKHSLTFRKYFLVPLHYCPRAATDAGAFFSSADDAEAEAKGLSIGLNRCGLWRAYKYVARCRTTS